MSYGVIAYQTEVKLIQRHVVNSKNLDRLNTVYEVNSGFFQHLDQLYIDRDCISSRNAIIDIYTGNVSRDDEVSAIKYRYIAEALFRIHYDAANRLMNDKFYPVKSWAVTELFRRYNGFPIKVPPLNDFPLTALISSEELKFLQQDYSFLELPEEYHEQFEQWLSIGNKVYQEGESDLLLFYY